MVNALSAQPIIDLDRIDQASRDVLGEDARILIIGCGLLGSSLGLQLGRHARVYIEDISPVNLALARDLGAGEPIGQQVDAESIDLVLVCVPPDVTAKVVAQALQTYPRAAISDVASVKQRIAQQVRALAPTGLERYVGSHPMAGRERSGPEAADADLFIGRPWVITAAADTSPAAAARVRAVAQRVGAFIIHMEAAEHDRAVAAVSHLPQLMASLTAGCLTDLSPEALSLAGQGLRDTTRIAASDPRLWRAIVLFNAPAIVEKLRQVRTRLSELEQQLDGISEADPYADGAAAAVAQVIGGGNDGVAMIPGKHGGAPRRYAELTVLVPDTPGKLAQLLADLGSMDVNLEDLSLEHSQGAAAGIVRMAVAPSVAARALQGLEERGWRTLSQ